MTLREPKPKYTLNDYWLAPGGEGPLAFTWKDKPHRLLYDLISRLEHVEPGPMVRQYRAVWYERLWCLHGRILIVFPGIVHVGDGAEDRAKAEVKWRAADPRCYHVELDTRLIPEPGMSWWELPAHMLERLSLGHGDDPDDLCTDSQEYAELCGKLIAEWDGAGAV